MSYVTETTWICDRCECEIVMPERNQPADWAGVVAVTPPLMSLGDVKDYTVLDEPRVIICSHCVLDLKKFIKEPE